MLLLYNNTLNLFFCVPSAADEAWYWPKHVLAVGDFEAYLVTLHNTFFYGDVVH